MKDNFILQLSLAIGICAVSFAFIFRSLINPSYVLKDIWNTGSEVFLSVSAGIIDVIPDVSLGNFTASITSGISGITDKTKSIVSIREKQVQEPVQKSEKNKIEEDMKNSFSDEIRIVHDTDTDSGVVVPVFRASEGDEYMYFLIPSKDLNGK